VGSPLFVSINKSWENMSHPVEKFETDRNR